MVDVEGIGVLHQELAPAHHAEPGPHLVAELPLDMIQNLRQFACSFGPTGGTGRSPSPRWSGRTACRGRGGRGCAASPCRSPRTGRFPSTTRPAGSSASGSPARRRRPAPAARCARCCAARAGRAAARRRCRPMSAAPGPARSISRWEAICASAGVSFRVGMKAWDRRIAFGLPVRRTGRRPIAFASVRLQ